MPFDLNEKRMNCMLTVSKKTRRSMNMALKNFVAREPRPLPVFILADTSGSMRGEKIEGYL